MKSLKWCLAGLAILTLGLLFFAGSAAAQGGVTVTPAQLTVAGRRGAVETRTLLLETTAAITAVQVIPLDLLSSDGTAVFPATAIHTALPADRLAANGALTVPVTVDLYGVPSGEFSGHLLVRYHGGSLAVPVTVRAKDHWLPPILVLVAGVALGAGVSIYRARGRPRDEALVRMGRLRAQMQADGDLAMEPAAAFRARVEALLLDVEATLQAEKWEAAQQGIEQAEAVLNRWRKGRADWLTQFDYHTQLLQRLGEEDMSPASSYLQAVSRDLEDALRDAPDMDGPDQLRERLDRLAGQINRYARLQPQLDRLNELRANLPPDSEQVERWRLKALELQQRLDDLPPGDEGAYQTLRGEMAAAIAELDQLVARRGGAETAAKEMRGAPSTGLHLLPLAPTARPLSLEEQASGAQSRLRWFTWVSYGIAVLLLAGAGFGELYVTRATFGSNAWGDYFSLLAWGFGAEATRAAITDLVRGWGLPGIR